MELGSIVSIGPRMTTSGLLDKEVMQIPNLPKSKLFVLLLTVSLAAFILQHTRQPRKFSSRSTLQDIPFAYYTNGTTESTQKFHTVKQKPRPNENETRYSPEAELILKKFVPQIFQRVPKTFLPEYKNPCWFEDKKLKCLPYFYQIGSFKSGTSDLWDKLVQHPSIGNVLKEPHWWAWRRFGYTDLPCHGDMVMKIRALTGEKDDRSFDWYLNWFDFQLKDSLQKNPQLIFGDASITTLWGIADGRANYTAPEPIYVLADIIHALQPNAKIIAILRNPLKRAMSEYFYSFKATTKTPEQFHAEVKRSLLRTQACLEKQKSARACAFSLEIGNWRDFVPLHGAYYLYLKEWIRVYGRERVHVIQTEDWIERPAEVLSDLINYLELEPLSESKMKSILHRRVKNTRKGRKKQFQTMMNETRKLLEEFYQPWNDKLVNLLGDSRFSWNV